MVSAQQQSQAHDPNADLFDWYFRCADSDRDGLVSGPEAFAFLRRSGLSMQVISKVWDHVDRNKTGFLGRAEFYNVLKLVAVAQSRRELTPETMKAALDGPAVDKIQVPWIDFTATTTPQSISAAASVYKDDAIASFSRQKQGGNAFSSTTYHVKQEASAVSTAISSSASSETSVSSNNHDGYGTSHSKQRGGCQPVKKPGPVTMDHVLLALGETKEEREQRIRSLFSFFDTGNAGYLDYTQIEIGLSALQIPSEYKYARDLLNVCDANKDGRVDYQEFKRYMDDKELELYRIFQAIDVEHNGCILPEELYDALLKAGIEIDDEELATFVERVDKDNNGVITFEEWRDFLLLYPHEATMENIYHYLERVCLVDIGEQTVIPEGISKSVHASRYLIAGGVAGAVSRTATAPLDRLKVVLQVQTTKARTLPAIKSIWKEGGFLGFFRGNGLNVLKVAPESAIRFYTYEMLKDVVVKAKGGQDKGDVGAIGRLFSGGLAGAVAQTSVYPMDLVKTRLQTYACEGGKAPNLIVMSRDIWVQEGPRAFYRGLVPSVLGIIPYAGIDLATYETLKDISKKYILHDEADGMMHLNCPAETGPVVQLGCGMVSGALGATCVYPLQVVRTRMQAHPTNTDGAYKGMSDVFKRTFQREGFRGFYKGLFPNMLKVVPSASITYLVYETMKKSLHLE